MALSLEAMTRLDTTLQEAHVRLAWDDKLGSYALEEAVDGRWLRHGLVPSVDAVAAAMASYDDDDLRAECNSAAALTRARKARVLRLLAPLMVRRR